MKQNKPLIRYALVLLCVLTAVQSARAVNYYWVGGPGNWNDLSHWATTSGGSTLQSIVPSVTDNVIFDAGSSLGNGQAVTLTGLSYCDSMTWTGISSKPVFATGGNTLEVHGSLRFLPGMSVSGGGNIILTSVRANESLTTGNVTSNIPVTINGSDTTTYTLTDSLKISGSGSLNFTRGNLTMSGRYVSCGSFTAAATSGILDMAGATITLSFGWSYSVGMPVTAAHTANSTISLTGSGAGAFTGKAGDVYNNVVLSGSSVSSATFNKITYVAGMSLASINRITTDTLILAPLAVTYYFNSGTTNASTVNKYFQATIPYCNGLIQLFSVTAGSQATVNFGAGAVVNVVNTRIRDLQAQGASSPYMAASSFDQGNNAGWSFTAPGVHTYYWVNGPGNWNDQSHWAVTSGGTSGNGCVPTSLDNVVFDAGSSLGTGQAVTLTGAGYCDSMTWSGISGKPVFATGANTLEIHGSLRFLQSITITGGGSILFASTRANESLTTGNNSMSKPITINGSDTTTYTLTDSLKITGTLSFTRGNLIMSGCYVSGNYLSAAATSGILDIAGATLSMSSSATGWAYPGGKPVTAARTANSTIISNGMFNAKAGDVYYNLVIAGATVNNATFNKITYTAGTGSSDYIYKIKTDTLILSPLEVTYTFNAASTINKYFQAAMPPCSGLMQVLTNGVGNQATLSFGAAAVVNVANVRMRDIKAQGTSSPYVAATSFNLGNNVGWNFTVPDAHTYYWVNGPGNWSDQSHWAVTSNGTPGSGCVPTPLDNVIFDAGSSLGTGQAVTLTGESYCDSMTWTGMSGNPVFAIGTNSLEVRGSLQFLPGMTVTGSGNNGGITFVSTRANESLTTGNVSIPVPIAIRASDTTTYTLTDSLKMSTSFPGALSFARGNLTMSGRYVSGYSFGASSTSGILDITGANISMYNAWSYTTGKPVVAARTANSTITITSSGTFSGRASDVYYNAVLTGGTVNNATFNKVTYATGMSSSYYINNITTDTLLFGLAGVTYRFYQGATSVINKAWYASGNPCNLTNIQSSSTTGVRATVSMPATAANFPGGVYGIDFVRLKDMNAVTGAGRAIMQTGNQSIDQGNNLNWNIIPYGGSTGITGLGADTTLYCNSFPYTLNTAAFQGDPSTTYLWDNGTTAPTRVVNTVGQYRVTVNYGGACTIKDTIALTQVAMPTLLAGIAAATPDNTLTLTASGLTGSPLYVLDSVLPAGTITTPVTQASNVFTVPQTVTTAYVHVEDQTTGCTAFATTSIPLPLIITAFTAAGDNCHARLNWTAGHVDAGAAFTVERSNDGILFESIATIPARTTQSSYSYTDADAGLKAGNRYYRLKLSEASGNYAYSTVREVKSCNSGAMADFRLSPNPVTRGGAVTLYYDGPATEARCQVTGMQGNALFSTPAFLIGGTAGSHTLRLDPLVPGTYMITLVSAEGKILGRQKLAIW